MKVFLKIPEPHIKCHSGDDSCILEVYVGSFFCVGHFSLDFSGGTLKVHRVGDFLGAT